jgi:diacylglycerol kinase (ATP)
MTTTLRPRRAKLIFNATAGRPEQSPRQLAEILTGLRSRQISPEVFLVRPNSRVGAVVQNAVSRGIGLVVVAGGDGTIDSVAGAMAGSSATLGIIPTGTRNNLALSLGIPSDIADAVRIICEGRRLKIDVGNVRSGRSSRWFLEGTTLGLLSDLYPLADDIQHGDLTQIGNLLGTFISSTPSRLRVVLDGRDRLKLTAHMVLIANMPYLGPHFQVAPDISFNDGLLDVLVYSEMTQMDLIAYTMQAIAGATAEDARIKHYRVQRLTVHSDPPMLVLADGVPVGQGPLTALVRPHALSVMAGEVTAGETFATSMVAGEGASHG